MNVSSQNTIDCVGRHGIIPVVTLSNVADAVPLARSLSEGGLPIMEITFRTDAALRAIETIAESGMDILLGAGTVLTVEQAKSAFDAGARFVVSPGLKKDVVEYCHTNDIAVFPGVLTPTEIGEAQSMGVGVVKFFPAEAAGGIAYLKAVSAPFTGMKFIPTGGIDETNIVAYMQIPSVLAVGGSWMVRKELIARQQFGEVMTLTARSVRLLAGLRAGRTL